MHLLPVFDLLQFTSLSPVWLCFVFHSFPHEDFISPLQIESKKGLFLKKQITTSLLFGNNLGNLSIY